MELTKENTKKVFDYIKNCDEDMLDKLSNVISSRKQFLLMCEELKESLN